ncbi:MAG TPA: MFS transporter [Actinophytocola sp.]|nr:MFS transporter [Actinophytocola sp.]
MSSALTVYTAVLRAPGVLAPALGAAIASVPIGMLGLSVLLLVQQRTGMFAAAGVVVAVLGLGTVTGMLLQGRLIDRWGARWVLAVAAAVRVLATAALVVVANGASPVWALASVAAVVGLSEPQVSGALRACWPVLVGPVLRPAATALSSVLFEVPVLSGPLLVALVTSVWSIEVALCAAAVFAAVGACVFAASPVAGRRPRHAPRAAVRSEPLSSPGVRLVVLVTAVQGLVTGVLQVTTAATATTAGTPESSGVLFAVLTAGSLVGTTLYGARTRGGAARWSLPLLLSGLAGSLAAAAFVSELVPFAVCLVVFGLASGPLGVRCFVDLERHAPAGAPAAAVTVLVAAGLAATSAGSALAGWALDRAGTVAPLLAGAGSAALAAVVVGVRAVRPGRCG